MLSIGRRMLQPSVRLHYLPTPMPYVSHPGHVSLLRVRLLNAVQ
jgi:hypothetical protein